MSTASGCSGDSRALGRPMRLAGVALVVVAVGFQLADGAESTMRVVGSRVEAAPSAAGSVTTKREDIARRDSVVQRESTIRVANASSAVLGRQESKLVARQPDSPAMEDEQFTKSLREATALRKAIDIAAPAGVAVQDNRAVANRTAPPANISCISIAKPVLAPAANVPTPAVSAPATAATASVPLIRIQTAPAQTTPRPTPASPVARVPERVFTAPAPIVRNPAPVIHTPTQVARNATPSAPAAAPVVQKPVVSVSPARAPVVQNPVVTAPAPMQVAQVPAPVAEVLAPVVRAPAPLVPAPVVHAPAPVAPAPTVRAPAPVVPAPVVHAPAPVVPAPILHTPAPVVAPPVVRAPAPVVPTPSPVVRAPAPMVPAPSSVVRAPAPVASAPAAVAAAPAPSFPEPMRVAQLPATVASAPAAAVSSPPAVVNEPAPIAAVAAKHATLHPTAVAEPPAPVATQPMISETCSTEGGPQEYVISDGLGCAYGPGQSGAQFVCGVDCGVSGAPCDAGWRDAHCIPWSLFGPGEYVGPSRSEHVSNYYLRVNDLLTLTYINSRQKAGERYRLGVGDVVLVESSLDESLKREVQVQPDGQITLPIVGEVMAAGKTIKELREDLVNVFKEAQRQPQITVSPVTINAGQAEIIKAVTSQFSPNGQALTLKVTPEGTIQVPGIGSVYVQGLTLEELRTELEARYLEVFGSGLMISPALTTRATSYVFVGGEVKKPNRYTLEGPTTATQAVTMAGSWNIGGNLHQVVVFRRDENWCLKAIKIDIRAPLYGNDPCPVNDVWLRDNDLVIVPKSKVLCATDIINLYFTRGVYAAFPVSFFKDLSRGSTLIAP